MSCGEGIHVACGSCVDPPGGLTGKVFRVDVQLVGDDYCGKTQAFHLFLVISKGIMFGSQGLWAAA
jgi:hypothetical protein